MMNEHDAVDLLKKTVDIGIDVWLDGGWGVDSLVGRQTRPHNDLDVFIERKNAESFITMLVSNGYHETKMEYTTEAHTVWQDTDGRIVDLHVFEFGNAETLYFDGEAYPASILTGKGTIGGISVRCLTAEAQLQYHQGYALGEKDRHDVLLLCQQFGFPIPGKYRVVIDQTVQSAGDDASTFYNIRGKTSPLIVSEESAALVSFAEMRKMTRIAMFAMRNRLHENRDTGWKISIGRKGIEKTLSEGNSIAHFQALKKLPELLRNAVLVKKSGDRKDRKNVYAYYRFYAPISIGGALHAAQITVSEGEEEKKRFYLQRLQIEKPAVLRGAGDALAHVAALRPAGQRIMITQLLHDVKSEDAPAT